MLKNQNGALPNLIKIFSEFIDKVVLKTLKRSSKSYNRIVSEWNFLKTILSASNIN